MCTGFTDILPLAAAIIGGVSTLAAPKPPKPPEPVIPALPADAARAPGAIVRVGAQGDDTDEIQTYTERELIPTRARGKPIESLGRSGLAL